MNYLGIDYGKKRIGLAFVDELKVPYPLQAANQNSMEDRLDYIAEVITSRKVVALVVGYPINMDGSIGPRAKEVDHFIETLQKHFKLEVHRVDERLTSQQAAFDLQAWGIGSGKSLRKKRKLRSTGDLDSRAATLILQDFLENGS